VILIVLFAATPAAVWAEGASVGGPMLGYVADPEGGVRPIRGIPGAAIVGERQAWGMATARVEVSPSQDYALTVDAEGAVARVELGRAATEARPVEGAVRAPERIVMSPGGGAALLVKGAEAQVVLGAVARASFELPVAGAVLAVSDRGNVLAAGRGSLYLFDAGEAKPLQAAGPITALAFSADGRTAMAAGPGQLAMIDDVAGTASWRWLATLDEDLGSPVAVAEANGRAVVATGNAVLVVGQDGAASRFAAAATGLSRLQGNAFRLTGYGADPMWMIEVGPEPRLLFIPPAAESGEVAQ
jgi:hypothetical protein